MQLQPPPPTLDRPRVFFDSNAGGWCSQMPGRRPVQAVSWAAAWSHVCARLAHPSAQGPATGDAVPAAPARSWWHRLLAGAVPARNQGDY